MNNIKNTFWFVSFVFMAVVVFAHEHHQHIEQTTPPTNQEKEILKAINEKYVQSVKPIFQEKCFNCHSNQTKFPFYYKMPGAKQLIDADIVEAKKHIDMSNDFPFQGHGTPKEDLEAIAKSVTNNDMPPFKYKMMHWKSGITKQEREQILQWTKESLESLEKIEVQ